MTDPDPDLENYVRNTARHLSYPPTPELKRTVPPTALRRPTTLRLLQTALTVCVLLVMLLSTPDLRNLLWQFSTAPTSPAANDLNLQNVRQLAEFDSRLPISFPVLGTPTQVIFQDNIGATLIWSNASGESRLEVQIREPVNSPSARTWINYRQADLDSTANNVIEVVQLPNGYRLVWRTVGLIYQLDTDLPLNVVLRIASSLTTGADISTDGLQCSRRQAQLCIG